MAKERWKLTDAQWKKIEPLLPKPKKSKRGGRPWAGSRKYSKVFSGYCAPAHHGGQICQNNIQVLQHVDEGLGTGKNWMSGSTHGELFFLNSTSEDN